MLHPYANRTAAETRARVLTERTGEEHTTIVAPRCLHSGPEAWYVLGPRTRPPKAVDYPLYGTNKPETWASDVLQYLSDPRREVDPEDVDRWRALLEPVRRGSVPHSARHTVRVEVRISPEHDRRLRALTAGDPVSRAIERLIDAAYSLPPATMALLDKHGDLLRAGVPESDPERVEVERQIRVLVRGHDGDPPKMTAEGNAFARSLLGEEMD